MSTVTVAGTTRTVELPAEIFDVQVNGPGSHQGVVAQLSAARQGTHDAKTRGEVGGGVRKPCWSGVGSRGVTYSAQSAESRLSTLVRLRKANVLEGVHSGRLRCDGPSLSGADGRTVSGASPP